MTKSSDQDESLQVSSGFMESLPGVKKLKHDLADLYQSRPKKKHRIDTRHTNPSNSDLQSISSSTPHSTRDSCFHHGIQKKLQRKIKMGQIKIEAVIDLHGYRQHEASLELEAFMEAALKTHSRMVLIIHGKGFRSQSQAILRPMVQHWLSEQPMVLAYCPAQPQDGGSGASYVYLKNRS